MPQGDRELRLYVAGGMVNYPEPLLRLATVNGVLVGELYMFWLTPSDSTKREFERLHFFPTMKNRGCQTPRSDSVVTVCRLTFTREPDWERLSRYLDSLGVWTLPDPKPSNTMVTDIYSLYVERRVGAQYVRREYRGAEHEPGANGARLRALFRVMKTDQWWLE